MSRKYTSTVLHTTTVYCTVFTLLFRGGENRIEDEKERSDGFAHFYMVSLNVWQSIENWSNLRFGRFVRIQYVCVFVLPSVYKIMYMWILLLFRTHLCEGIVIGSNN